MYSLMYFYELKSEANSHSNQENINKDGTKTDGTEGTSTTSSDQAA